MLQTLRSGAAGWVAKIFLGLLVLSFAVWGIEDIFRIGGRSDNAAVVGERNISVEQFRTAYQNEIRRISNQAKRVITPEQARMAGLGDKVLGDLINEAAIDAKVQSLGLSLSEDQTVQEIQNDEIFRGPTGQFDRTTFREILRQNNLSESQYLELQRNYSARKQLTDALMANVTAPDVFRQAIHRFNSDSRSISYVELKPDAPNALPAPSEAVLREFYDSRKSSFAAPEFRKIAFISLDPEAVAAQKQIPEAELKAYFDANQPKEADREKRSVEQITFPTMEAAKTASDEIKGGKLFEQVMAEQKLKPDDIFLGNLTKAEMLDPKIADAAFALKQGQISEPVQGAYANVLLRVTGIQTEAAKPFEAVKDEIRGVLAQESAKREVLEIHDKIDEARLGGATLAEIAKANNLQLREVAAVDAGGKAPDGSTVDLPMSQKLLDAAFRAEVGGDTDTLNEGDAYAWFDLVGVTEPKDRSFEEARAAVEKKWREEEVGKRLDARAEAIMSELKGGKTFDQVATAQKVEVASAETTRLGGAPSITPAQAKAVFQTPVEGVGQTAADEKGGRLVFRVTAENDRPFDASQPDQSGQMDKISQSMGNDLVSSLVKQLRDSLGTRIESQGVAQVVGGAS